MGSFEASFDGENFETGFDDEGFDLDAAVERLHAALPAEGQIITHRQVCEALGIPYPQDANSGDLRDQWRALRVKVQTAAFRLLRQRHKVDIHTNVVGQGYLRLPPGEITAEAVDHGLKKARRALLQGVERLEDIDTARLNSDELTKRTEAQVHISRVRAAVRKPRERRWE